MVYYIVLMVGAVLGVFVVSLCQVSGRCSDLEETQGIYHAKDDDDLWFCPTENPFRHICCDCGLTHTVEFAMVDREGEQKPFADGALLALKFKRM